MKLGAHVSIAGGFERAAERAIYLGCESFQIFSRSPRGGKARALGPGEVSSFRHRLEEAGIGPVLVHVPYLLNLAAPDGSKHEYAKGLLAEDLRRAELLGAVYLVTHVGSYRGDRGEALQRVIGALRECLQGFDGDVMLLLENTAGARGELGSRFEEIAAIIEKLDGLRVGLCLDTCHAFAAGYDISTPEGLDFTIGRVNKLVGIERLRALHLNDSKGKLSSGMDRHEHIGDGCIGVQGFSHILRRPELQELPGILETPVETPEDDIRNLNLLKGLRSARWGTV